MSKPSVLSGALSKRITASQDGPDTVDKAYDEMFGLKNGDDKDKIVELDLALVKPHPRDPFKPYSEDKLKELADSIAKIGLLDPINVRPCGDGTYEILAGKNRSNAARMNGDKKIKAIARDIDDDTAIMIITDSNLKHREKLLPSEKAFAYKLQLEAIKKQGNRSDLKENKTSVEIQQKISRQIIADVYNVKDNEIQRYIRLTSLIPELLDLVDSEEIPLMAGVDLSHIDVQSQTTVYHYFLYCTRKSG
jgi:ParB family chromosome partitioning protein